jgi:ribosome-associated protein
LSSVFSENPLIARKKDEARALAKLCARLADDKKGERIVVLRMTELIVLTDYFVITNGTSRPQVQAIADEINETMSKLRVPCLSVVGYEEGRWVLLDYGDVVVHVFDRQAREFYDLEHLWADAPRVRWRSKTGRSAP